MKIYISGQISNLPLAHAKSLFQLAEYEMQNQGYVTINPFELDHKPGSNWVDYMITDIKELFNCDGIYMINNWKASPGARIEHAIAIEMGKKVLYQPN